MISGDQTEKFVRVELDKVWEVVELKIPVGLEKAKYPLYQPNFQH